MCDTINLENPRVALRRHLNRDQLTACQLSSIQRLPPQTQSHPSTSGFGFGRLGVLVDRALKITNHLSQPPNQQNLLFTTLSSEQDQRCSGQLNLGTSVRFRTCLRLPAHSRRLQDDVSESCAAFLSVYSSSVP